MTTVIPYFDWPARSADWADDLVEVFQEVAESDEFILKSRVERLEAEIAARTGAAHAVAVASGTGALTVVLAALGLGDGDEVVTPAFSFVSTASTVALRGARPVFADVEYETGLLDPAAAEAAVTDRTRALLRPICSAAPRRWAPSRRSPPGTRCTWSRTARSRWAPRWTASPPAARARRGLPSSRRSPRAASATPG